MTIQVQPNFTSAYPVHMTQNPAAATRSAREAADAASDAYVYNVDKTAEAKSQTQEPDTPLSWAEFQNLRKAYLHLGEDNPLWENIDALLTDELMGNDRTNFLSALAEAGDLMGEFVHQVERLEGEDRSLFLSTAVRNGSGDNLENLIDAAATLSGGRLTTFLETADALGRTVDSVKAGELRNFVAAVAESPGSLEKIVEKIEGLNQEDRAMFLKGAADAGDDLEQFIAVSDLLSGTDLTNFLKAATNAGEGFSSLLTLTENLADGKRSEFLRFTADLSPENAENFLVATQGEKENIDGLMATTRSLAGPDRDTFLALAADAGDNLERFTAMVDKLRETPGGRSDFLTTALKADKNFHTVLDLAENLGGDARTSVFSFAANLEYTDLTNFVSAATADASTSGKLVETAKGLSGNNRSYLLYAASQSPDNIGSLTSTVASLSGAEKSDFLFAVANKAHTAPSETKGFLNTVNALSGQERETFLANEKAILMADDKEQLSREYVHLNAVLTKGQMDTLMTAGAAIPDFDRLVSDFNEMDRAGRDTFLAVAETAGKEILPDLMAVTMQLDEDRNNAFMDYARTLGQESLGDLVKASARTLSGETRDFTEFDALLETARSLDPAVDQDFLNAAAAAGKHLDRLIETTHKLDGFLQADFLSVASHLADRPGAELLLDNFMDATDYVVEHFSNGYDATSFEDTAISSETLPSALIKDGKFTGGFGHLEGFMASSAFLAGKGLSNTEWNNWFNTWQGTPVQA